MRISIQFVSGAYNVQLERKAYLLISVFGGCRERMDDVITGVKANYTILDIVVEDSTRHDLLDRVTIENLLAATNAERRKQSHDWESTRAIA